MKLIGIILLIAGVAGDIIFGLQASDDSNSFTLLGTNVAVSHANWTPLIVSGVVTLLGIILLILRKKS